MNLPELQVSPDLVLLQCSLPLPPQTLQLQHGRLQLPLLGPLVGHQLLLLSLGLRQRPLLLQVDLLQLHPLGWLLLQQPAREHSRETSRRRLTNREHVHIIVLTVLLCVCVCVLDLACSFRRASSSCLACLSSSKASSSRRYMSSSSRTRCRYCSSSLDFWATSLSICWCTWATHTHTHTWLISCPTHSCTCRELSKHLLIIRHSSHSVLTLHPLTCCFITQRLLSVVILSWWWLTVSASDTWRWLSIMGAMVTPILSLFPQTGQNHRRMMMMTTSSQDKKLHSDPLTLMQFVTKSLQSCGSCRGYHFLSLQVQPVSVL